MSGEARGRKRERLTGEGVTGEGVKFVRRWALRISLLIVLGMATNVAIAWIATAWSAWDVEHPPTLDPTLYDALSSVADDAWLWGTEQDGVRARRAESGVSESSLVTLNVRTVYWYVGGIIPTFPARLIHEYRAGWPMRSLTTLGFQENTDSTGRTAQSTDTAAQWSAGVSVPVSLSENVAGIGHRRPLPLRPVLPGFVVNTILYAGMWFGLILVYRSAQRVIRVKRGCCRACGYDLRGSPAARCPECGSKR